MPKGKSCTYRHKVSQALAASETDKEKEEPEKEIQKKTTRAPSKRGLRKAKAQARAADAYVATLIDALAVGE